MSVTVGRLYDKTVAELYWTWELIDKTRKEIYRFLCASNASGNKIHLKRKKQEGLEYGFITDEINILYGEKPVKITVTASSEEQKWEYDSIDDMVVDGWVLD